MRDTRDQNKTQSTNSTVRTSTTNTVQCVLLVWCCNSSLPCRPSIFNYVADSYIKCNHHEQGISPKSKFYQIKEHILFQPLLKQMPVQQHFHTASSAVLPQLLPLLFILTPQMASEGLSPAFYQICTSNLVF